MPELDFFHSVANLEPKCPKCQNKIVYGVTTKYRLKFKTHVCVNCGEVLR